jgi:hypothetical protein
MRTILLAAAGMLAALSASASAQGDAPAAAASPGANCYIELQRLMADAPAGIGDLGAAIRALDLKLRPQVEEINALKTQIARLEQRDVSAAPAQPSSIEAAFEDDAATPAQPLPAPDDRTATEIRDARTQLDAKRAQLKLDYDAQRVAIIGPVQAKVGQRVQAFATERGCAQVKMARAPDLEGLRTAAAQDITGEFVAWYLARPPA